MGYLGEEQSESASYAAIECVYKRTHKELSTLGKWCLIGIETSLMPQSKVPA